MHYGARRKISRVIFLSIMIAFAIFMSVSVISINTVEYNYPVISYRYFRTGIFFGEERVEVIYRTDSETVKKSYSVYSIEIGEKTEVVVYKRENLPDHSKLYITKEDYESLLSLKEVKE